LMTSLNILGSFIYLKNYKRMQSFYASKLLLKITLATT
jgi:hypothetical protein